MLHDSYVTLLRQSIQKSGLNTFNCFWLRCGPFWHCPPDWGTESKGKGSPGPQNGHHLAVRHSMDDRTDQEHRYHEHGL